jgi:GTP-binding protein
MFIDKAEITIKAGNGGNGHTSFHRDMLTQRGGPNGGDGGRGGDIVFVGSTRMDNLVDFQYTKSYPAPDGGNGGTNNKHGADGNDLLIPVPLGTKIKTAAGEILADITETNQKFIALRGGAGGRGNSHFATSRRQTPNFSHSGVKTAPHDIILELECIADVGIIGFPNVGKSTFLSIITRANPKIGNYAFTTLHPNIGICPKNNLVFADIPGLVEGAGNGVGLGIDFLKHISRTRLLLHFIDAGELDGRSAVRDYEIINKELKTFSAELAARPQIVVLNKIDCLEPERLEKIKRDLLQIMGGGMNRIFEISCAARSGIDELLTHIAKEVAKIDKPKPITKFGTLEQKVDKNEFTVSKAADGTFVVSGAMIDNLVRGVVLSDTESASYFHRRLEQSGVIAALLAAGMSNGDVVRVADVEFEWYD